MPSGLKTALLFTSLVALGISARLLDLAPNAAGIASIALFAGWLFRSRLLAIAVPLTAMLISDAVIGGYQPAIMLTVYACLLAPVLAGRWIGRNDRPMLILGRAALGAVGAAVAFFLVTNLAVWAFAGYYPPTLSGLSECYLAALPFFRFTLGGDLAMCGMLFGSALLVQRLFPAAPLRPRTAVLA